MDNKENFEILKKHYKSYVKGSVVVLIVAVVMLVISLMVESTIVFQYVYLAAFGAMMFYSITVKIKLTKLTNEYIGNEDEKYGKKKKVFKKAVGLASNPNLTHTEFLEEMRSQGDKNE
ncbi:MAG: hypothetical protein JJV90_01300 [Spiroplasma sp.]|nr:hypothetical protein [Mycoplasmatales bacterium]